jgi:uncharacterized Zn finger protein
MNATSTPANTKSRNWVKPPSEKIAQAITLVGNVRTTGHPDVYVVDGIPGSQYLVRLHRDLKTSECTCSTKGCKHQLAVALVEGA